ncbi:MAG TPA: phosphopantetheine-binding protein, partial [Polyangiaceae bacterium]|nr:phosphopantetheine-binding protein [Polyangiaceae bacterium]
SSDHGQERLVAYFASKSGVDFTDTELRRHVRAQLPESMVPQLFIELPALPRAADGAIEAGRLPPPFGDSGAHDYVAPRNANELLLAELYAEALGVPRVSVYDNFFDLGGHSLACFRVLERIEARAGVRLSPRTMLLGSLEQVAAELPSRDAASPPPVAAAPPAATSATVTERVFKKLTGLLRR